MVKNYLKSTLPAFITGILASILTISIWNVINPEMHFATVNITQIVDQFIKAETEKNLTPDTLKQEIYQFGKKLELSLKILSKENHLILLPSEAVIAGVDDATAKVNVVFLNKRDMNE